MDIFEQRRSIRRFLAKEVDDSIIYALLRAASYAPSGLNNQPWRFRVVKDKGTRTALAGLTKYSRIVKNAPVLICVFLDTDALYHREKDIMGIGAAIQNILLKAHTLGLGGCWLGEILNKKGEAQEVLRIDSRYELMAVIAIGYPAETPKAPKRLGTEDLMI